MTANAQTTVFEGDNSSEIPYRIPAIVQTSGEDILVFADKRHNGGDVGQNGSSKSRIDVVYKRFSSNTWGNETTVKTGTNSFGYGDVAVVADRENPAEIVFFTAAGNTFFTKGQVKCFRFRSSDGGVTWDKDATTGEVGTEVTSAIYNTTLGGKYTAAFFSSGRICQSSKIKVGTHYRLYAALCVTGTNSIVIYSDDFGDSWYQLGDVAAAGGDEAKCVELPNGNVLVSSKGKSTRYYNVFKYNSFPTVPNVADGSWAGDGTNTSAVSGCTTSDAQGTNGELLLVQASKKGQNCYLVMQTVPAESSSAKTRKNVTLYWKELDTTDLNDASQFSGAWTNTKSLSTTTSSYSTMIQLADGTIAFAYEENYTSFAPLLNFSGAVWDSYDIQYRNMNISDIASGYTLPVVSAPVITPASGTVDAGATVTISCATEGAVIYYTTDGSTPNASSAKYTGSITVNDDVTIKAIAVKRAWVNSAVATATLTAKKPTVKVATPVISPAGGEVEEGTEVTISCATDGATIYYTNDGTEPTAESAVYTGAITVTEVMTIKAIAAKNGNYTNSEVASASFTIKPREVVATPVINPAGGEVEEGATVTISCATSGATVYYTTDGSTPTTSSAVYSGAITVNKAMTIKAMAIKAGYYTNSEVASATFTIKASVKKVATPVFSLPSGVYEAGAELSVTCATEGAKIYLALDPTWPAEEWVEYSGEILEIGEDVTIYAVAKLEGWEDSDIASAEYVVILPVATPAFSPAGGEVEEGTEVTITCATDGATIYYTTDGTEPTTESAVYTGVITVIEAMTIKAMAAKEGYYTNSAVAVASFTIKAVEPDEPEAPEANCYPVSPVTGKIGNNTYYLATFSAGEHTVAPSGVSVYYAVVEYDEVLIKRVPGGTVIPAGTGVVLMSASDNAFNMTATTAEPDEYVFAENCLVGTYGRTGEDGAYEFGEGCYVLAKKGATGQFAFCNAVGVKVSGYGNRAYLDLSGTGASMSNDIRISIGGTTGIEEAVEECTECIIYDLTGRRVTEMKPGSIYIVNGKKVYKGND